MRVLSLLGLSQLPLLSDPPPGRSTVVMANRPEFSFKEGTDLFTPKDLIELARPGTGVANEPGDLVLVPISQYSFDDKK